MAESIFSRYGGFARISRVVSDFYSRARESNVLSPYFENIEMRRLIDHQTKFIASITGGPASFTDEHLRRVHAPHKIDDEALDEMATVLRETLEDHDFDATDVSLVIGEILLRRQFIVAGE